MTKKRKTVWEYRRKVEKCDERTDCDCPYCKVGVHCLHIDNDTAECDEGLCPRFDGKRWKD